MDYKTIKRNYERGLWSESMVRMAVRKGLITQEESDAIIGGREIKGNGAFEEAMAILNGEVEE